MRTLHFIHGQQEFSITITSGRPKGVDGDESFSRAFLTIKFSDTTPAALKTQIQKQLQLNNDNRLQQQNSGGIDKIADDIAKISYSTSEALPLPPPSPAIAPNASGGTISNQNSPPGPSNYGKKA